MIALGTERLLLRPWQDENLKPYAAPNACPVVKARFGGHGDRLWAPG